MEPTQKLQDSRLIMLTGCTKNIGFNILLNLAMTQPNYKFLMAVKSLSRGEKAINELKQTVSNIGDRVTLHQLDIMDSKSIDSFIAWIKEKDLKINCLVNCANVNTQSGRVNDRIVNETFKINFYGTVELIEKLVSVMPDNSKIVNLTSELGMLGTLQSPDIRKQLFDSKTIEDIISVAKEYQEKIASKKPAKGQHPFPTSAFPVYSFSKLLLNVYTKILANRPDLKKRGMQVYCCSPSWISDELNESMAESLQEAGCPSKVINLPFKLDEKFQGKFFSYSEVIQII